MSLRLYYHPLSSYCWKVLTALYEKGTPFEPLLVNLGDEAERNAFHQVWPVGKFPVLRDDARNRTVPESTIIIEYLDLYYPGKLQLIPADAEAALQTRAQDRFFDWHLHDHMQRTVANKLRPADMKDPLGTTQFRTKMQTSYSMLEDQLAGKTWITGEAFTMADCAAAPALYYGDLVEPIGQQRPNVTAYLERLKQRPSFARVLEEAQPYFKYFPGGG